MQKDKFPTQALRCARKKAQVWTPMSRKTLNDIFRNQLPRDRERRRREEEAQKETEEETVDEEGPGDEDNAEEEEEAGAGNGESANINALDVQSEGVAEMLDFNRESSEDWYVSKENLWHLLLDKDLPGEAPGKPDDDRALKLGIGMSLDFCNSSIVCKGSFAVLSILRC